jgi:hypothetical protein
MIFFDQDKPFQGAKKRFCSFLIRYDSIVNAKKQRRTSSAKSRLDQHSEMGFSGSIPGLFSFLLTSRFHPNRLQKEVETLCSLYFIPQRYEEERIVLLTRRRQWIL